MLQFILYASRIITSLSKAQKFSTIFKIGKQANLDSKMVYKFQNLLNMKNALTTSPIKNGTGGFTKNGINKLHNVNSIQKSLSSKELTNLLKNNKAMKFFIKKEIQKTIPQLANVIDLDKLNFSSIKDSEIERFQDNGNIDERNNSKKTMKWHYVTRDKHSDFGIHSLRYLMDYDKSYSMLEIRFFSVRNKSFYLNRKIYTWKKIPTILITIMLLTQLGGVLPSGYRAGALHFFMKVYWKPDIGSRPFTRNLKQIKNKSNFLRNRTRRK